MSDLVHTPSLASKRLLEYVESIRKEEDRGGLRIGVSYLDNYLAPAVGGKLWVIMGRPGMGKSSLLAHIARRDGLRAAREGGPYPVVITAEMAVEEYMLRELSHFSEIDSFRIRRNELDDGEWEVIRSIAEDMPKACSVIYVGHSLTGSSRRRRITVNSMKEAIDSVMERYRVDISSIYIDYLQRIGLDRNFRDRRIEMSEIVERCKDMALEYGVPVFLGVQAGRSVDLRNPPVPMLGDGKETGNIEETADTVLGVFRPARVYDVGDFIPGTDPPLVCEEHLFFINVLKQRDGMAGRGFWVYFDMSIAKLSDLELIRMGGDEDGVDEQVG